jgi:hypothetical protein
VAILLTVAGAAQSFECPEQCTSLCAICGDNPAASAEAFFIYDGVATWEIAWEHETREYFLESADDPTMGEWLPVAGGPWRPGQRRYSTSLPAGAGEFVRLVEIETDGNRRVLDYARQQPTPTPFDRPPAPTVEELRARVDSLLAVRTQGLQSPAGAGTLVVYAPSAFMSDLQAYFDYGTAYGYTVIPESIDGYPTSPDLFRATLKQSIATHAGAGAFYFHLVGDANDWQEFDGPLTSQYWVGSWESVRQSYLDGGFPAGGQPLFNVIPTYAVADTLPPGTNQARWYPYWTSDQPYADVDDDGYPDVVVTRWPATDVTDVVSFVGKTLSYGGLGGGSPLYVAELFVWDWENMSGGHGTGSFIRGVADSVAATLSAFSSVSSLYAFPNYGESGLVGPAVGEWNWNRPDLAVILGSESHRYSPGKFFSKKVGAGSFDVGMLASGHPAFVLGPTCGTGDWSMTEDMDYGPPVCEDFLRHPWDGAIAWAGPSAATWQQGNVEVIVRILDEVVANPDRPMAESWLVTMQRIASEFSDSSPIRETADSYMFFGDPLSRLTSGGGTPTGGSLDQGVPGRLALLPASPNPSWGGSRIHFSVPDCAPVNLAVYDVGGRRLRTLVSEERPQGRYSVQWEGLTDEGRRAAAGVYFVRLDAGREAITRKLVLLR